jgi:pilus assembly protein Flp/PilA
MKTILAYARGVVRDESGQGMVEYGLIIALIAVVVVVALTPLGTDIKNLFTGVSSSV